MENLDDDEQAWERTFRDNQDYFRSLAQEALDEHRRGEPAQLKNCWASESVTIRRSETLFASVRGL
jgi:hypothetical protein